MRTEVLAAVQARRGDRGDDRPGRPSVSASIAPPGCTTIDCVSMRRRCSSKPKVSTACLDIAYATRAR
ncbi:hypothetical protein ACWEHA_04395 [Amycolatopsis nivea]